MELPDSLTHGQQRNLEDKLVTGLDVGTMRRMWRSPRGKAYARKIAFREVSFTEHVRIPLNLLFFELVVSRAFPTGVSADEDAMLWEAIETGHEQYSRGRITMGHVIQVLLTLKGVTNVLGWDGVAPSLDPSVRGPTAYVLGHWFLQRNDREKSVKFFRTAEEDGAEGSLLRRLAAQHLSQFAPREPHRPEKKLP